MPLSTTSSLARPARSQHFLSSFIAHIAQRRDRRNGLYARAAVRWCIALVVVLSSAWVEASAATYYWRTVVPSGVQSWSNPANWSTVSHGGGPAVSFPGAADVAVFGLLGVTPNAITFSGLPAGGVGTIDGSQLQVPLSVPAGQTLSIVGTGSTMGGNATFEIFPGAMMRIGPGATVTGAGGGNRWQIGGTLEIVDNGAVVGSGMWIAPGATLRYTGTMPATTGWEWMEGMTNLPYAAGFPANVVIQNSGGVVMSAATSFAMANGSQLNLQPGGILAFSAGTTLNMLNGAGYCGGGGTLRGNATATFIKGTGAGACGCIGFSAPQVLQNFILTGGFALVGNLTINGTLSIGTGGVLGVGSCTVGRLTLQGTNTIAAGGLLDITGSGIVEIDGNAPISGAGSVNYASAATILRYIGTATPVVAGIEWPATMAGQVVVNKTGANVVQLNAAPTRTQNAALTVQSGYLDVLTTGNLALGGVAHTVQSGAYFRVLSGGTASGLGNLSINGGGTFNVGHTGGAAPVRTGIPNYSSGSTLLYSGGNPLITGSEFPTPTMNGNVTIDQNFVTNAAARSIAGAFTVQNSANFNTGAFSVALAGTPNAVAVGSVLNVAGGGTLALNNVLLNNNSAVNVAATGVVNCINLGSIGSNLVGYAVGGTLVYSGAGGSAATNAEFPGGNHNVIINKPGSAYGLTASKSVDGSFTLQAGQINLGGNDLTLNGPIDFIGGGTGRVVGNAASNLTIGSVPGGAVTGPLTFNTTLALNNFSYNRPAGLTLGSALTVNGSFTLNNAAGSLNTGAFILRLAGTPNTTIAGSALAVSAGGRLIVNNTRTLTNAGTLQVGATGTLELNGTAQITTAPTYLAATSVLEYTGPTPRPTCGPELTSPTFAGSIRVNNIGSITAPNYAVNLNAGGTANFSLIAGNWILSNPAAALQLNTNPIVGGSATSFIQMSAEANSLARTSSAGVPLTFPIGTAVSYLPVQVTNPSAAANISAFAVTGAPPGGTNGTAISNIPSATQYWGINAASACTSPLQFTNTGAIVASNIIGQNGSGVTSGAYNQVATTNAAPNSVTTTPAINLNAGPNYQRFAIGTISPPTQQATSFSATAITMTSFSGSFGAANAPTPARYLVVMRPLATAPTSPTNSTGYTPGGVLGGGIVLADLAHAAGIINIPTTYTTGLTPGGQYAVDIYSYNGAGASATYLTSPTTGIVYLSASVNCAPIPTTVNFSALERTVQFTGVSLTGAGVTGGSGTNTAFVTAGGMVTLSYNYSGIGAPPSYCPGCITQLYVGMDNAGTTVFQDCFSGNPYNAGGSQSPSFTAPATPGVYYINSNASWQYSCIPVNFAPGYVANNTIAKIIVGAPPCVNQGDILTPETTPAVAFAYSTTIPYISHLGGTVPATAPNVFAFQVRDGGAGSYVDGLATTLTAISIQLDDANGVVQAVRLYDGVTPISGNIAAAPTMNFTGLNVIAADGTLSNVITVKVTYKTTPTTPPMDGAQFRFTISGATTAASGSGLLNPTAMIGPSGWSGVNVLATSLAFIQQPTNTGVGVAMTPAPTVRAVDANGNVDLNYPPTINVSHPNLVGSPVAVVPVGGTASFPGLVFNSAPLSGISLSAAGGTLGTVNSAPFDITPQVFYLQAPFVAQVAGNWNTLPSGLGAVATAFTYPGSIFQTQAMQTGVVGAPWVIAAGVSVNVVANSTLQIQTGQTFTKSGTLSIAGAGTLELQGNAAIVAGAAVQYQAANAALLFTGTTPFSVGNVSLPNAMGGSVVINRTGGLLDMTGPINVAGNFTMNAGSAVINGGTNLTVAGTTAIAGGSFDLNATATMNANGPFIQSNGVFNQNNGSVIMGNTFTLSAGNYNASGTGNLTLAGASTINGGNLSFSGSGNLAVNNALNISSAQLSMNGTGSMTVAAGGTLNLSGSGQVYLGAAPTSNINGSFSLAGGQFDISSSSVNFNGSLNFGTGVLNATPSMGSVTVGGAGAITGALQSISPGYANFTMNRAGTSLALGGAQPLNTNTLNLTSGYIASNPTNFVNVLTNPGITAPGTSVAFVAGPLAQTIAAGLSATGTAFFPVGRFNGATPVYLPVQIQNATTGVVSPTIVAEAFIGAPPGATSGPSITDVDLAPHYWRVQPTSGNYISGYLRFERSAPPISPLLVVGGTTTAMLGGVYNGFGASGTSISAIISNQIPNAVYTILPNYYVIAGPPAKYFYYQSGDPTIASNWNSKINGMGSPAATMDFTIAGNVFAVPSGRTAALASPGLTLGAGVSYDVQAGGTFEVGANAVLQSPSGGQVSGALRLVNSGTVGGGVVLYNSGSTLEYAGTAARMTTALECPSGLAAAVVINNTGGVTIDAAKTIGGGLTLQSGTFNFTSKSLTVNGPLINMGGTVTTNAMSELYVGGAGSITGLLTGASTPLTLGTLYMQRAGRSLALGSPTDVTNLLSTQMGVIQTTTTNVLTVTNAIPGSIVSNGGYVEGPLRRAIPANATGTGTYLFPLGRNDRYLPSAFDAPTTGPLAQVLEAETLTDSVGTAGFGLVTINNSGSSKEYLRMQRRTSGTLSGRVQFTRTSIVSSSLMASTVATMTGIGAFNLIPSTVSSITLSGGPIAIDSAQSRYFIIGGLAAAPFITIFSPTVAGTNATVTVIGGNYIGANLVTIGGISVPNFTIVSSGEIRVQLHAGVTGGTIVVSTPSGNGVSPSPLRIVPAPIIRVIAPISGFPGTVVTVTGANLTDISNVSIGTTPALTFSAPNDTTLYVVVGDASGHINVTSAGGQTSSAQTYTTIRVPFITEITPTTATVGTEITITGRNFTGTTIIEFGTTATTNFTVISDGEIRVTVPNGATTPITVTNGAGNAQVMLPFTINGSGSNGGGSPVPQITGFVISTTTTILPVTNANGMVVSTSVATIQVNGTNLSTVTLATVNGFPAVTLTTTATGQAFIVQVPFAAVTTAKITIIAFTAFGIVPYTKDTTQGGAGTSNPPVILNFSPRKGSEGDSVKVVGRNFLVGSVVTVGGEFVKSSIRLSSTEVICVLGLGSSGQIRVSNSNGTAISDSAFFFRPVILDIAPTFGSTGSTIIISGRNFDSVTSVRIGGVPVRRIVSRSDKQITAIVGAGMTGPIELQSRIQLMIRTRVQMGLDTVFSRVPFTFLADENLAVSSNDSLALVRFYAAANGRAWRNSSGWNTSTPLAEWAGVTVTPVNGVVRVTRLILPNNGIPFLSEALADLSELRVLNVAGNTLESGSFALPQWVGRLKKLEELRANNATLRGRFTDSLTALRNLRVLDLSNNQITGGLPEELAEMIALREFSVAGNRMMGALPERLGELANLELLDIMGNGTDTGNRFDGEIPRSLSQILTIKRFRAAGNRLSGSIPPFGIITAATPNATNKNTANGRTAASQAVLSELDLSGNILTGSVPATLGNLPVLSLLGLNNNRLSGALPAELWNAPSLSAVYLHVNRMTGELPGSIRNARFLRVLTLDSNRFTGAVPDSVARLPLLQVLSLSANQFTYIPDLSRLGRLDTLRVDNNSLTFESLEPNKDIPVFIYRRQAEVIRYDVLRGILGKRFELDPNIGGEDNVYRWYRLKFRSEGSRRVLDTLLLQQTGKTLVFERFAEDDAVAEQREGYYCLVTNPNTPDLTISLRPVRVATALPLPPSQAPELIAPARSATEVAPFAAFEWNAVEDENEYELQYADNPQFTNATSRRGLRATSTTIQGLTNGQTYYWRVRATNQAEPNGNGPWSESQPTPQHRGFTVVGSGIALSFPTLDFGRVTMSETAVATARVTNLTNTVITLSRPVPQNTAEGAFAVAGTQDNFILQPNGGTADIPFAFSPKTVGTKQANVELVYTQNNVQARRTVTNALVGRAGTLFVKAVSFDTVLNERTAVATILVENRGPRPAILRNARILAPKGTQQSLYKSLFSIETIDAEGIALGANGDATAIIVRCRPTIVGQLSDRFEIQADIDTAASSMSAVSRARRASDVIISVGIRPDTNSVPPGSTVNLQLYLASNKDSLFNAGQPEFTATVRYGRQILSLNEARGSKATRLRNTNPQEQMERVSLADNWDGRDAVLARIPCLAVQGSTDATAIVLESLVWGRATTPSTVSSVDKRVFVETLINSTFTSGLCKAGGTRLVKQTTTAALAATKPNPASDQTTVVYTLREAGLATITLYDTKGTIIKTIVNRVHNAGQYELMVNLRDVPSGAYMIVLETPSERLSERFDVVK